MRNTDPIFINGWINEWINQSRNRVFQVSHRLNPCYISCIQYMAYQTISQQVSYPLLISAFIFNAFTYSIIISSTGWKYFESRFRLHCCKSVWTCWNRGYLAFSKIYKIQYNKWLINLNIIFRSYNVLTIFIISDLREQRNFPLLVLYTSRSRKI